jgi:hypothetical protein
MMPEFRYLFKIQDSETDYDSVTYCPNPPGRGAKTRVLLLPAREVRG